jgi:hypothetical protein
MYMVEPIKKMYERIVTLIVGPLGNYLPNRTLRNKLVLREGRRDEEIKIILS